VLLNNGSGVFLAPTTYGGSGNLRQVVAADLNNDGFLDLAAGSTNTPLGVMILLNNHSGQFNPTANLPLGMQTYGVAVYDYDADGFPDIFASSIASGGLHRFKGNGNATFQQSQLSCPGVGGNALSLADTNGDGLPEAFIPSPADSGVHFLLNIGAGTFVSSGLVPTPTLGGTRNIAVVDFTADGLRDLLIPCNGAANVAAHVNIAPSGFGPPTAAPTGPGPIAIATGDLNGDGLLDFVTGNSGFGLVSVVLRVASLQFTTHPASQTVDYGENAVLTAVASAGSEFVWRRNGVPITCGDHYSGVDSPTLTILEATNFESGSYDCVVTVGTCSVASNAAAVTVVPGCGSPDFDGDGDPATDADIEAFFRVLGGGSC
jgi:hypothetical protein